MNRRKMLRCYRRRGYRGRRIGDACDRAGPHRMAHGHRLAERPARSRDRRRTPGATHHADVGRQALGAGVRRRRTRSRPADLRGGAERHRRDGARHARFPSRQASRLRLFLRRRRSACRIPSMSPGSTTAAVRRCGTNSRPTSASRASPSAISARRPSAGSRRRSRRRRRLQGPQDAHAGDRHRNDPPPRRGADADAARRPVSGAAGRHARCDRLHRAGQRHGARLPPGLQVRLLARHPEARRGAAGDHQQGEVRRAAQEHAGDRQGRLPGRSPGHAG